LIDSNNKNKQIMSKDKTKWVSLNIREQRLKDNQKCCGGKNDTNCKCSSNKKPKRTVNNPMTQFFNSMKKNTQSYE
jgi:hypothetical protein